MTTNTSAPSKEFVFRGVNEGVSKKTGKPYTMIQLHDPDTLENTDFFLREGQTVHVAGINFKDRVTANFTVGIFAGRPQLELASLTPVKL